MGDGDCAGETIRGFWFGIGIGADEVECAICGVLFVMAGESGSEPNCILELAPPTGPPFGKPCAIVTEPFRL